MFREYCKRVRQFYGLQRQDSQSLEGRREASIFPRTTDENPKQLSSPSSDIKTIDVQAKYKTIERK